MKRNRFLIMVALAVLVGAAAAQDFALGGQSATKDKNQDQGRNLTGQVLNHQDAPLPTAIVYLKNTKTLAVKSFIAENDGGYRFHGLSPNVDYQVYAEYQGQKSGVKTVSAFDNRTNITLNLHIDTK